MRSPFSSSAPVRSRPLHEQLFHGRLEPQLAAEFFEHIGHRMGDPVQAALHMIDAVAVFGERQDAEKRRAMPRRHAEVLRLEGEGELQPLLVEVIAEHVMHAAGGEHIGQGAQQTRPQVGAERLVGMLEARIDLAEFLRVIAHVAAESAAAARKHPLDLGGHFFRVAVGVERGVAPAEAGHRIEIDEIQVVLAACCRFRRKSHPGRISGGGRSGRDRRRNHRVSARNSGRRRGRFSRRW